MRVVTEDGRTVGFTPYLRGVIHPDDRDTVARLARATYRSLRVGGWDRATCRHATGAIRLHYAGNRPLYIDNAHHEPHGIGCYCPECH